MKKLFFIVAIISFSSHALDKYTVPFTASDTMTAAQFNSIQDTTKAYVDKIIDTINRNVPRYTSNSYTHDLIMPYLRLDTIRSNPDVDSIRGFPAIDTIRTDSIISRMGTFSSVVNTDSIRLTGGIAGTTADFSGINNVDSLHSTRGISGTIGNFSGILTADSLVSNGGITFGGTLNADSIYTSGNVEIAGRITSQYCERGTSLCTLVANTGVIISDPSGATRDTVGTIHWTRIGGIVSGYISGIIFVATIASADQGAISINNFPSTIASDPYSHIPIATFYNDLEDPDTLGSKWILSIQGSNATIRGAREGGGAKAAIRYITFTYLDYIW
ncbi:MAG: hypothetical protein JXB48_21180 [Candidatus Latescibacteria bacterium]|nr:hypothetical protein [Candidatus Latescibacterota bacterium]